jgi:hypothetical protein
MKTPAIDFDALHLGFKLVTGISPSFSPFTLQSDNAVRYSIDKLTVQDESKRGPFAVFYDFKLARQFSNNCSVIRYGGTGKITILGIAYIISNELRMWFDQCGKGYYCGRDYCDTPIGTVLAKLVLPLTEIDTQKMINEDKLLAVIKGRLTVFRKKVGSGMPVEVTQEWRS